MQEDKHSKEAIKNICLCSHNLQLLCVSAKCKNSALVCGQGQCSWLRTNHKKCTFISPDKFVSKIMAKRKEPSSQVRQTVNYLLKLYDQAIDKLSRDRQSITVWQDHFGLSPDDYRFVQLIKRNRVDLIRGELAKSVFDKLNTQQSQPQYFTQTYTEKLWKQQKEIFERVFQKFNVLFRGFDECDVEKQQVISKNDQEQKQFIAMARRKRWEQIIRDYEKHKTLKKVSYLDLGARSIFHIPIIKFMPNVTRLWLNSNRIEKIQNLQQFPALQFLSLHSNKIRKIQNLQGFKILKQVHLQNNKIQHIQLDQIQSLSLIFLDLSNNPIVKHKNEQPYSSQIRQLKGKVLKVQMNDFSY